MATPRLSIIVCMNGENPFIDKALTSLEQASMGMPVEKVLVTNGGYAAPASITKYFDQTVEVPMGGLGNARNRGVEASRGDFVTFFDADDVVERGYLESILRAIENGGIHCERVAYSNTRNIGPADEPIGASLSAKLFERPARTLWFKHPFTGATLVISKAVFLKVGGYKWGGYAEDYELSIRLHKTFGEPLFLCENYYIYRLHGSAMSSNKLAKIRGVMAIQLYAFLNGGGARYFAGALVSACRLPFAVLRG